jgi:3-methylornithyl-N6-L-lysine dehydrogenase
MTRLTSGDIDAVCDGLEDYDRYLLAATGQSLLGIGAAAAAIADVHTLRRLAPTLKIAVVPIRSGLGVISGFSRTVCGILRHLGFDGWMTDHADVAGFADAVEGNADVVMAADDDRFVAFCLGPSKTVDNSRATANGFVAGLDLMAAGLESRPVLVLGCGPVGRWVVRALVARGASVSVVDPVPGKAEALIGWVGGQRHAAIRVLPDVEQALKEHDLIVDATNAADIIHARHVTDRTRVAAPGMPRGLTDRAMEKLPNRVLHDPLQIGVAAMACEAARITGFPAGAKIPDTGRRGD